MRTSFRWVLATSIVAAPAGAAAADTEARQFGAREEIRQVSLSPNGKRILMLRATPGAGTTAFVTDIGPGAQLKGILSSTGRPDQLRSCSWATDTRVVCTVSIIIGSGRNQLSYTRLLAMNADGSGLKELSNRPSDRDYGLQQDGGGVIDWLDDGTGSVLMTRSYAVQNSTGTLLASNRSGIGVDRVNTATLERSAVEAPRNGAVDYISDGHGNVRVMGVMPAANSGYTLGRVTYLYRRAGRRDWEPLSTVTIGSAGDAGFVPEAVDAEANVAYGFDDKDGRAALYRISLDGSLKRELVLANPEVDVDDLITVGRQRRVVGASFATDKRQSVFFDPALKTLGAALSRSQPGTPLVTFVDASADGNQLVLFAGSDNDPGRYYLLDRGAKKLTEIMPVRPQLAGKPLATVKPIRFKAADGTMIPAYLTLPAGSDGKGLPAIVMPHGGPGDRDEWGFDWLSQFYAARGYAVLQPNYRGSAGYGGAWFQKNGFQSWRTAIGDVNDAGRYLLAEGIAAPGKLAIVGWSYGGYAALQTAMLDPDLFKAIVAIAPVTDLETLRSEHRNFTDYNLVDAFIGHGPDVRAGSPAQNVERIKAPVMMFHGDLDQNVGIGESRLMASRLRAAGKPVELVEYKGLTHQLDDSEVRSNMLGKSDAFLRKTLGL